MTPLPRGHRLVLDRSVRRFSAGTVLVGGQPGRILRLSASGASLLRTLVEVGVTTDEGGELARRLVDAGMASPVPPTLPPAGAEPAGDVTVVVPVRDRPDLLDRCLASLGDAAPVVVVDDASADPGAVAAVCRRHGARLVTRVVNGGPGPARNQAIAATGGAVLAFVDSDCIAPPGWLEPLLRHFDDPEVGAVAPRIRPAGPVPADRSPTVLDRYLAARSSLDLGPEAAEVGPGRKVPYVPTAALLVRRRALDEAAIGFDPALRYGEDVDLVWRLVGAGWRVRYVPSVVVTHREPDGWGRLLARRFRYGTSAGPLSVRHPGALPIVELRTGPTIGAGLALSGRIGPAAVAVALSGAWTARRVQPFGIPPLLALRWAAEGAGWTAVGLGRAATVLTAPLLVAAIPGRGRTHRSGPPPAGAPRRGGACRPGRRGSSGRRIAVVLLVLPPAVDWWRKRPALDPFRWLAASLADDAAYAAGVWSGCLRARTLGPLLPAWRPGRRTAHRSRP